MLITWIDTRSVLWIGKKAYKAGDVIPAGAIPEGRLEYLVNQKRIRLGEPVIDTSVKKSVIFGVEVESKVVSYNDKIDEKPKRGRPAKVEKSESDK